MKHFYYKYYMDTLTLRDWKQTNILILIQRFFGFKELKDTIGEWVLLDRSGEMEQNYQGKKQKFFSTSSFCLSLSLSLSWAQIHLMSLDMSTSTLVLKFNRFTCILMIIFLQTLLYKLRLLQCSLSCCWINHSSCYTNQKTQSHVSHLFLIFRQTTFTTLPSPMLSASRIIIKLIHFCVTTALLQSNPHNLETCLLQLIPFYSNFCSFYPSIHFPHCSQW